MQQKLTRRQLLKAIAAGGVVTAAGLWMPGTKLISIPKPATGGRFEITGQLHAYFNDPALYEDVKRGGLTPPGRIVMVGENGRRIEMEGPDLCLNVGDLVDVEHGYRDEARNLFTVTEIHDRLRS